MFRRYAKPVLPLVLLLISGVSQAQESLDFYAEHAIEGFMDARYLALPQVPEDLKASEWRLRFGGLSYQSGGFATSAVLLDVQRSRPLGEKRALLFGAFADFMKYSGDSGPALADPTFTREFDAISPFVVDVSKVSGSGMHFGVSAAMAGQISPRWGWQSGVVLEEVKVDSLETEFMTLDLLFNFSGTFDYAGSYDAVTAFGEVHRSIPGRRYSMNARLIAAIPFPSVGFKGRISGPGFETSGNSGSAGKGKHVPDPFLGLGFSVESRKTGFRIDLGATVYIFAAEGKIHRGVDTPLYLTFSFPLGHARSS